MTTDMNAAIPPEWREPALGWAALNEWEAEHGVELPEPYRTFVAETANGSTLGPPQDGGLLPLGWLPNGYPAEVPDPSAAFPLTRTWIWEEDPEADPAQIASVFADGSVVLGSEDGPAYWLLVVTGPARGTVWNVSEVGAVSFNGLGFGEWTARWAADPDGFPDTLVDHALGSDPRSEPS